MTLKSSAPLSMTRILNILTLKEAKDATDTLSRAEPEPSVLKSVVAHSMAVYLLR